MKKYLLQRTKDTCFDLLSINCVIWFVLWCIFISLSKIFPNIIVINLRTWFSYFLILNIPPLVVRGLYYTPSKTSYKYYSQVFINHYLVFEIITMIMTFYSLETTWTYSLILNLTLLIVLLTYVKLILIILAYSEQFLYLLNLLHLSWLFQKTNRFYNISFLYYGIIFISPFLLFLSLYLNQQNLSIFILMCCFIIPPKKYVLPLNERTLKFSNLVLKDILKSPVYMVYEKIDESPFKFIRIDLANAFPSIAFEKKVFLKSLICINPNIYDDANNEDNPLDSSSFYLCVPISQKTMCFKIHTNIEYSISKDKNAKRKNYGLIFILELRNIDGEYIPFINHRFMDKTFSIMKIKFEKLHTKDKVIVKDEDKDKDKDKDIFNFKNGILANYWYNMDFANKFKQNSNDRLKFLHHNGEFGNGKTSYDITMISQSGGFPIIITPWEDDYDHDILYLIFKNIKKETNTVFHPSIKGVLMYYCALLFATYTLLISNYAWFRHFVVDTPLYEVLISNFSVSMKYGVYFLQKHFVFFVVIPIIVLSLFMMIVPNLIVFKKDFTLTHQDFFIKEIHRMMRYNPKATLLVEDIDRLSPESMDKTFRILSAINKNFYKHKSYVGILSYSKENITNKTSNTKDYILDIENKLSSKAIGDDFDAEECKLCFIENIFDYCNKIEKLTESRIQMKEKLKDKNFRDIRSILQDKYIAEEKENVNFNEIYTALFGKDNDDIEYYI